MTPDILINAPELPAGAEYLWEWFVTLTRGNAGEVTYSEIKAWSELTDNTPTSEEVAVIVELAVIFVEVS
ncbi:hypothetical protein G6T08_004684 [Salmonella enterica]|uniref:phage tail assembly chaperone n=1 Tax=Salmonella enterica TaxID=28901 RepID=UPI000BA09C36|nr:hypothetical protein [Salmonella enterica]EBV4143554.1 hypothetical protein [Salmonella enterica subsp. enterica serovar Benin]EBC1279451.1 hypothetical protein [Salmonella enterica]EBE6989071.1 hypothetical protein [Salmonella enterica]EBE7299017.1 hypothetical protein [Salmonella enterica]EBW4218704.1 hypothetical protein [Salmonella enterica subsp. enterica serovar Benin]